MSDEWLSLTIAVIIVDIYSSSMNTSISITSIITTIIVIISIVTTVIVIISIIISIIIDIIMNILYFVNSKDSGRRFFQFFSKIPKSSFLKMSKVCLFRSGVGASVDV